MATQREPRARMCGLVAALLLQVDAITAAALAAKAVCPVDSFSISTVATTLQIMSRLEVRSNPN